MKTSLLLAKALPSSHPPTMSTEPPTRPPSATPSSVDGIDGQYYGPFWDSHQPQPAAEAQNPIINQTFGRDSFEKLGIMILSGGVSIEDVLAKVEGVPVGYHQVSYRIVEPEHRASLSPSVNVSRDAVTTMASSKLNRNNRICTK